MAGEGFFDREISITLTGVIDDPDTYNALAGGPPPTADISTRIHAPNMPDGDHSAMFREHGSSFDVSGPGVTVDGPVLVKTAITENGWTTLTGHVRL